MINWLTYVSSVKLNWITLSTSVLDFTAVMNDRNGSGRGGAYRLFLNYRNGSGRGVLIAYDCTNLPARRRTDLEFDTPIESFVLDVIINNRKWAVLGAYRTPSVKNIVFTDMFTKGLDKISTQYDNVLIAGELKYDMLDISKGASLSDICDIFYLSSLKSATCHMKTSSPPFSGWFTNKYIPILLQ